MFEGKERCKASAALSHSAMRNQFAPCVRLSNTIPQQCR